MFEACIAFTPTRIKEPAVHTSRLCDSHLLADSLEFIAAASLHLVGQTGGADADGALVQLRVGELLLALRHLGYGVWREFS